jgi:hypothetical protein
MFRLIKLAIYATLGYFAYEFIVGILNPRLVDRVKEAVGSNSGEAGHEPFSGGGEGMDEKVAATGGGHRRQKVGRGVVS